jgi:hypothetical protein
MVTSLAAARLRWSLSAQPGEIMSLLIAYTLLMLLALLWIAKDAETIYVFDVFGRNFHYVWFESGQRWTHVFTYGWRLVAICSLVLFNGILAYRIFATDLFAIDPTVRRIVLVAMIVASCAPIPWIYIANHLRWRRHIRSTALRLSDFAKRITADSDLAKMLDRADYNTDEPWTAWHPSQNDWKSGDSNRLWDGLIPVVYVRNDSLRSALFPIDWETFLAWNIPADCARINNDLPVHGALDSSFRVESVQLLRGCLNWCLVRTEMRSELDAMIEDRG